MSMPVTTPIKSAVLDMRTLCESLKIPIFKAGDIMQNNEIGSGSFGKVFKGTIKTELEDVAVKSPTYLEINDVQLYKKEVQLLSLMDHPNIVRLKGVIFASVKFSLVMEFMEFDIGTYRGINDPEIPTCHSLLDFLVQCNNLGATPEMAQHGIMHSIALDCASGLNYLHSKNVVHRDLKPGNVLLSTQNQGTVIICQLCDFGEARSDFIKTQLTLSTNITRGRGTVIYNGPEQFDDMKDRSIDALKRNDIWSFAMILFNLTNPSLKAPWYSELSKVKGDFVQPLKDFMRKQALPETSDKDEAELKDLNDLRELYHSCVKYEPTQRPTSTDVHSKIKSMLDIRRTHHAVNRTDQCYTPNDAIHHETDDILHTSPSKTIESEVNQHSTTENRHKENNCQDDMVYMHRHFRAAQDNEKRPLESVHSKVQSIRPHSSFTRPASAAPRDRPRPHRKSRPARGPVSSIRSALSRPTTHQKARTSPYPRHNALNRYPVPDDKISWEVVYEGYDRVDFTAPSVAAKPVWADPDFRTENKPVKWNSLDGDVDRRSHMGRYDVIEGVPRNPVGRSGMRSRGMLGKWGPNHVADPIVTRWKRDDNGDIVYHPESKKSILQFVAIQRKDSGQWALPGGMVDAGDNVSVTLKKEFAEGAMNSLEASEQDKAHMDKLMDECFKNEIEIYRGYVDDPRNTDNSWMETVAVNFHDESGEGVGRFKLHAGDDAGEVQWTDLDKTLELYASHSSYVQEVARRHSAHW